MSRIEALGYASSTIVAISLMLKDMRWLRVVNSVGALVFVVYGLLVPAYPVAALNGFIVMVNVYHLLRLLREGRARASDERAGIGHEPLAYP